MLLKNTCQFEDRKFVDIIYFKTSSAFLRKAQNNLGQAQLKMAQARISLVDSGFGLGFCRPWSFSNISLGWGLYLFLVLMET